MATGKEDPKLRAAYNAAVKQYGSKSKQALAARTKLNSQRASVGLGTNSSVGVAAGTTTPPPDGTGTGNVPGVDQSPGPSIGNSGPLDKNPLPGNKGPGNFSDVVNSGVGTATAGSVIGNYINNPNTFGPFGSSTMKVGPDGKPIVEQSLSRGNENIVGGAQGAGTNAYNVLGGFLGSDGKGGDAGNPLGSLHSATYNRMTGAGMVDGYDQTYARAKEQKGQTLTNRGIPVGSDLYDLEMNRLDQNYNLQKQQASEGATNAVFGQLGTLGQIGQAGYFDPKFQQFNTTQFQTPNVGDIYGTFQGGQNVAGTNATNRGIAQGNNATAIDVAGINAAAGLGIAGINSSQPTFSGTPEETL